MWSRPSASISQPAVERCRATAGRDAPTWYWFHSGLCAKRRAGELLVVWACSLDAHHPDTLLQTGDHATGQHLRKYVGFVPTNSGVMLNLSLVGAKISKIVS